MFDWNSDSQGEGSKSNFYDQLVIYYGTYIEYILLVYKLFRYFKIFKYGIMRILELLTSYKPPHKAQKSKVV